MADIASLQGAIQVPELPRLQHISNIYRDGWISAMICGKSGCGKTSLMARLIPGISGDIKHVIIATMVEGNPFHLSIAAWAKETGRTPIILHDPGRLRYYIGELRRLGYLVPGKSEALLIFDDFSIAGRDTSKHEAIVIEAFTRWRNLGVNPVIICQDAGMVDPSCRNCTNLRVLFNSASRGAIHLFSKDILDRIPDTEAYRNLVRYITSIPYSYILVRENPLEVHVGKGANIRRVMSEGAVITPTYRDLMSELGTSTPAELKVVASQMQKDMGNTAPELEGRGASRPWGTPIRPATPSSEEESEPDEDETS